MPQNRHVSICLRFSIFGSVSWPVEVIVPLQMGVELQEELLLVVPATPPVCTTLLLSNTAALRVMRLLALAQMRRLRSSLNKDFSGDTLISEVNRPFGDENSDSLLSPPFICSHCVIGLIFVPLLLASVDKSSPTGSCLIGIKLMDGVMWFS